MSTIKISAFGEKEPSGNIFEGYDRSMLTPQSKKLLKEWMKIEALCRNSDVISYIVRKRNREGLPLEYEIIYKVKSIVGVEGLNGSSEMKEEADSDHPPRKPIYGTEHRLSISLPANYPSAYGGNPEFKMITDAWHPNIRYSGKFKGRICLNNKDLGVSVGLDDRILRVGKYLQYQIYWANESYPWPEDKSVAEWVREEAEPNNWINLNEGIYCDDTPLLKHARKEASESVTLQDDRPEKKKRGDDDLTIKI